MKWRITTEQERFDDDVEKFCKWHYWFAWYPVIIKDEGRTYRVWLETVGRKLKIYDQMVDTYAYRRTIGCPEYCPKDSVLVNALKE